VAVAVGSAVAAVADAVVVASSGSATAIAIVYYRIFAAAFVACCWLCYC
jgi:hypothetical protein